MQQAQPLLAMNAMWVGEPPGALEIVCLLSAVARGHKVRLFSYERFPNIPESVEQVDAREILPESAIVRHETTGSLALFSDRFRYELIQKGFGAWMDADMLFLKPVRHDGNCLFAWESARSDYIGSSLLYFDPKSAITSDLCDWAARPAFVEPWHPLHVWLWRTAKSLVFGPPPVGKLRWGAIGPRLITHLARKHGLLGQVSDFSRFYAVPAEDKMVPMAADGHAERFFTPHTEAIHLWHQGLLGGLSGFRVPDGFEIPFQEGSLLWAVAREVGMTDRLVWKA